MILVSKTEMSLRLKSLKVINSSDTYQNPMKISENENYVLHESIHNHLKIRDQRCTYRL